MGADLLLTPEWPQGTGATLDPQDPSPSALAALGVRVSTRVLFLTFICFVFV
jgi:hypothetical protein